MKAEFRTTSCADGTYLDASGSTCNVVPIPTNVTVADVSTTQAVITWDDVGVGALSVTYRVETCASQEMCSDVSEWTSVLVHGPARSVVIASLRTDTSYEVRVTAEVTQDGVPSTGQPSESVILRTTCGGCMTSNSVSDFAAAPTDAPTDITFILRYTYAYWDPIPCERRHGAITAYRWRLTSPDPWGDEVTGTLSPVSADSRLYLQSHELNMLVPYTRYVLSVRGVNAAGEGPAANHSFTTPPAAPPTTDVDGVRAYPSPTAITVKWDEAYPPHGERWAYRVRYGTGNRAQSYPDELPRNDTCADGVCVYNISDLQANNNYSIEIQARNLKPSRYSSWSRPVWARTAVSEPSAPVELSLLARGPHMLSLAWEPPLHPNGHILQYKLDISVVESFSDVDRQRPPWTVRVNASMTYMGQLGYNATALHPATTYRVDISASTSAGFGPGLMERFVTNATAPNLETVPKTQRPLVTASTISVALSPIVVDTGPVSAYHVIVERISDHEEQDAIPSTGLQPANQVVGDGQQPGPYAFDSRLLPDFNASKALNTSYYVAAQLPPESIAVDTQFVVGDGKTYDAFWNAALENGQSYMIYMGIGSNFSGEWHYSTSALLIEPVNLRSLAITDPGETRSGAIAAIVSTAVAIAVLVVLAIFVISRRHPGLLTRRSQKGQQRRKSNRTRLDEERSVNESNAEIPMAAVPLPVAAETGRLHLPVAATYSDAKPAIATLERPPADAPWCRPMNPIKVEDLLDYVLASKATGALQQEYDAVPYGQVYTWKEASQHRWCNRYANIVAYDHSRVILHPIVDDDTLHIDYINANYISGYKQPRQFIATQGPTMRTFDMFWEMVWQECSSTVVMLSNLVERGKEKCEKYWPDKSDVYKEIEVRSSSVKDMGHYIVRTFTIKAFLPKAVAKEVKQFHFTAWPDHGVPADPQPLLRMLEEVRSDQLANAAGPIIVHCSAGVGRTGTFIALYSLMQQAESEHLIDAGRQFTLNRAERIKMIQNKAQYEFLHDALVSVLVIGDTRVKMQGFSDIYKHLSVTEKAGTGCKLHSLYQMLRKIAISSYQGTVTVATTEVNLLKNRCSKYLPDDEQRVTLQNVNKEDNSDYINARSVTCTWTEKVIAAQTPLANTAADFWGMVFDYNISTIVLLDHLETPYWLENSVAEYGEIVVQHASTEEEQAQVAIRSFTVHVRNQAYDQRVVHQFSLLRGWPISQQQPKHGVIYLIDAMYKWLQMCTSRSVAVVSSDGVTDAGTFSVLAESVISARNSSEVDIPQIAKIHMDACTDIMRTYDQFTFCYDVLETYSEGFDIYANV
ncbi:PREDICTED: receptor-type tyrosine-protein phosphatase kappa-like [Priapulus caudatus]|uniref:Receptor-type tyrosine-protein phosphatase kappa-like n=1 Tax=Priapulus caudatus TaxID=37621 RepID=A0ABM1DVK7_PRICU|nr:PREDICTED: receptor-type tyrosine-protein phosphatase kappa-like [Priapulus caudatus]